MLFLDDQFYILLSHHEPLLKHYTTGLYFYLCIRRYGLFQNYFISYSVRGVH